MSVYSVEEEIDGKKVVNKGIIYSFGDMATEEDLYVGNNHPYVRSYASTEAGKFKVSFSDSETASSYAMTMKFATKTVSEYVQFWRIRAYAELEDGSFVYSDSSEFTIFDIADALYKGNKMSNYPSHNYLYTDILSVVDENYETVDYDWNNSVVKF